MIEEPIIPFYAIPFLRNNFTGPGFVQISAKLLLMNAWICPYISAPGQTAWRYAKGANMNKMNPYPQGEGIVKWISTEWLEEHLKDRDLMILDIQPNIHDFISDHIPGALYVNEGLFRAPGKWPNTWLPKESIELVLSSLGVKPDIPTVVYTSPGPLSGCGSFIGDGLEQTMVAYTLARYGHNKVYVLDGGLDKWKEEKRPVTRVFRAAIPSDFTATVRKEYFIEYDEFRSIKDRSDVVLFDARPSAFYEGQGPWIKPGHIPGAVSLPWKTLMDDKNKKLLKPEEEILGMVRNLGATPDKTVICSCGTGREATNEFILFKWFLKYPKVRIYEGSFTEWTSYPDNPVVTGKNPR